MSGPFDFIDPRRIACGIQFGTNRDRCIFLGTLRCHRERWLMENRDKWRPLEDIPPRGAVSRSSPPRADGKTRFRPPESNTPASSGIQKEAIREPDIASVNSPSGDCRSSDEPEPLPAPATVRVQEPEKDDPAPRAEAAAIDDVNPDATSTAVESIGNELDQGCVHRPARKKRQPGLSRRGAKRTPERMRIVLDNLRKKARLAAACRKAHVDTNTVYNWLKRSAAGASGYDLKWLRRTLPFHEHYEVAMELGRDSLIGFHYQRGILGYDKVLKSRGRASYKIDPFLQELGFEGPDAYLRDKNGKPIPETVPRKDKKSVKWLENCLPEKYGKHRKDDSHRQGQSVLVIRSPLEILQSEQESSGTRPGEDGEIDDESDSGE